MDFTFGIITNGENDEFIKIIINSIEEQNIPNYEIIIVGKTNITHNFLRNIPFDESIHNGWFTKKKNIIHNESKYDNIVVIHDYICFTKGWYEGFLTFGDNYNFCITKITNKNGRRYRDYTLYPAGLEPHFQNNCLLPYNYNPSNNIRKLLYISGAYYIIKKSIALLYPLNEILLMGYAEDVDLSQRLSTNDIHIVCNPYSTVSFLKYKEQCGWENELTSEQIIQLEKFSDSKLLELFNSQKKHVQKWIYKTKHILINPY